MKFVFAMFHVFLMNAFGVCPSKLLRLNLIPIILLLNCSAAIRTTASPISTTPMTSPRKVSKRSTKVSWQDYSDFDTPKRTKRQLPNNLTEKKANSS